MVSTDMSLFKVEAPRFPADFVHPLSSERPFKFPRHLIGALEIIWIIATSDKNIRSAVFNWHGFINRNGHGNGHGNKHGNRHGHRHGHRQGHEQGQGHGIRILLLSIRHYSRYSTVWTYDTSRCKFQQRYKLVALPLSKGYDMLIFKKLYRHWAFSTNDVLAELEISVWVIKKRPLP